MSERRAESERPTGAVAPRRRRSAGRHVLRGTLVLMTGHASAQALSFARHVIVARLLSPEDLGVAAAFLVMLTLMHVVSDLAADKMLIQAEDGDDPDFQRVVQGVLFLRGLVLGAILLAAAWPAAALFGVPEARPAFLCVALVPVLRGLVHLDSVRWQRTLRFGPHVMIEIGVHVALTLAAWPLCVWFGNYVAVVWLLLAQGGLLALGSHAVARRRYGWCWDPSTLRRLATFGWPLVINGGLLFVIMQGDQLLVGSFYSVHALGLYAVAFALAAAPTLLLARVGNAILLPLLSRRQGDRMEFESALRGGAGVLAAIGGLFGVTFLLAGPWLLAQIYGAAYAGAGAFIGWLGAMQAVRLMRVAPTQGSIAHGDTRTSMIANAWRMSALGLSIPVAIAGADVLLIAAAGCVGECAAFVVTVVRLQRRHGVPWTVCGEPAALAMAVIGLFALGRLAGTPPTALVFATALAAAVTMIAWRWRRRGLDGSPRDRIGPTRVALGVSSDD